MMLLSDKHRRRRFIHNYLSSYLCTVAHVRSDIFKTSFLLSSGYCKCAALVTVVIPIVVPLLVLLVHWYSNDVNVAMVTTNIVWLITGSLGG